MDKLPLMKAKRHYFYLPISIVNTVFFVSSLSFVLTVFVFTLVAGNTLGVVTCGIMSSLPMVAGIFYAVFDGWASWQANEETITTFKLFRGTKTITVSQISSIDEGVMETFFFDTVEKVECYEIRSGNTVIKLPKCDASDALVIEVRKRYNI